MTVQITNAPKLYQMRNITRNIHFLNPVFYCTCFIQVVDNLVIHPIPQLK